MAVAKGVWGIDIGQCALKALRLELVEEVLPVERLGERVANGGGQREDRLDRRGRRSPAGSGT